MADADGAPGMSAIDAAMVQLHGPQTAPHWVLDTMFGLGTPCLESLSAYDAGDCWHFVTLGLSEIWSKGSDNPAVSGLGFEFTMRVRKSPKRRRPFSRRSGGSPPAWATRFLQRLGDVTLADGTRFRPGETLDPGGSITGDPAGRLVAVGFVEDPSLRTIDTPNGSVSFIQVVGMTGTELEDVRAEVSPLSSLAGPDGMFVTDSRR